MSKSKPVDPVGVDVVMSASCWYKENMMSFIVNGDLQISAMMDAYASYRLQAAQVDLVAIEKQVQDIRNKLGPFWNLSGIILPETFRIVVIFSKYLP